MKHFEGKSVVLTGGTGGIGSKVAKKLLKAGKLQQLYLTHYN
jgi:FlaA1/EpsC-like NDP-sugar epimerase